MWQVFPLTSHLGMISFCSQRKRKIRGKILLEFHFVASCPDFVMYILHLDKWRVVLWDKSVLADDIVHKTVWYGTGISIFCCVVWTKLCKAGIIFKTKCQYCFLVVVVVNFQDWVYLTEIVNLWVAVDHHLTLISKSKHQVHICNACFSFHKIIFLSSTL